MKRSRTSTIFPFKTPVNLNINYIYISILVQHLEVTMRDYSVMDIAIPFTDLIKLKGIHGIADYSITRNQAMLKLRMNIKKLCLNIFLYISSFHRLLYIRHSLYYTLSVDLW